MPRTGDVNDVRVVLFNQPVQMNVDEILSRRSSPMAEQSRLDLLCFERFSQQGILKQVDLADAKIVRGAPVAIYLVQHLGRKRTLRRRGSCLALAICRNSRG